MNSFYLKCKILRTGAKPFAKGRPGEDSGFDIWTTDSGVIWPGSSAVLATGIATAFPVGWAGLVFDRSSTGKAGLIRLMGVIDSGYRNEWFVKLHNLGTSRYDYGPDRAIAQVVFVPCGDSSVEIVESLEDSVRGGSGFGSSDQ